MKVRNALVCVLVASMPLAGWAQDDQDEFYSNPDGAEGSAAATEDDADDADVSIEAEVDEEANQLPFRGSTFTYENIMSAASQTNLSAEAAFYYAMSYSFRPRYYLSDWFSLRLRLDIVQELTDASNTTSRREPRVSDTWLYFHFGDLLASVSESVGLGAYLRLVFPTSKGSQARTVMMGATLGTALSYTAPVLEGLRLSYGISGTKYFNQQTTAVTPAARTDPLLTRVMPNSLYPGTTSEPLPRVQIWRTILIISKKIMK